MDTQICLNVNLHPTVRILSRPSGFYKGKSEHKFNQYIIDQYIIDQYILSIHYFTS